MKKFKQIDVWISISLISIFTALGFVRLDYTFFVGYFVVGGWQVISMLVHIAQKWFTDKGGARYIYNWITLVSLITFPLGTFWILLFTAPFMAVYYTYQCYDEVYVKMQRPPALLK